MQHLLGRAKWEADQVRDDLRDYVVEHLHDDQAVLVVDLCRARNYADPWVV
jgi:SRSO17 transposase